MTTVSESLSLAYGCGYAVEVGGDTSGACAGKPSCEAVPTPESVSLALIPIGLGALLLMRKRMGPSRPAAS